MLHIAFHYTVKTSQAKSMIIAVTGGYFKQFHSATLKPRSTFKQKHPLDVVIQQYRDNGDAAALPTEARIYALLPQNAPHIIRCYGSYKDWGLVMERVSMGSLEAAMPRVAYNLTLGHDIAILYQIGRAMHALEKAGVVHCNLALDNVLLCAFDRETAAATQVKVTNLSRARVLHASKDVVKVPAEYGELLWMAPEVRRGNVYALPSDVWAFGITAMNLLTRCAAACRVEIAAEIETRVLEGDGDMTRPLEGIFPGTQSVCYDALWSLVRSQYPWGTHFLLACI